jgi:selenocysteine-specific elongation factor
MIIGTAGHIDHGKTSLVRALTGVDTDRLKEEKERGISIELGYAYVPVENGNVLGYVDVPGHERLVHTMVAGACGIDFVLLVIAADDGVMPQTREHLAILELLGVTRGAVALSKIDRVDGEHLDGVRSEVMAALASGPLRDAPLFAVNTTVPDDPGTAALRRHLHEVAAKLPARSDEHLFRLAVDRVFTLTGHGTVVTGTVFSGQISTGDTLAVMPVNLLARVRSIHAQNCLAQSGHAGERCALNLVGVEKDAIKRGDWLAHPLAFSPTTRLDVRLRVLAGDRVQLRPWSPLHIHLGTTHRLAHLVPLESGRVAAGESQRVQLVFETPLCAMPGDRFIARDAQAARTVGGGMVLDPFAPGRKRRSAPRLDYLAGLERMIGGEGLAPLLQYRPYGLKMSELVRLTGRAAERVPLPPEAKVIDTGRESFVLLPAYWQALRVRALGALGDFHLAVPDEPGPDVGRLRRMALPDLPDTLWRALIDELANEHRVIRRGPWLHLPEHTARLTAADQALAQKLQELIATGRFDPPWVRDLARAVNEPEERVRQVLIKQLTQGAVYQVVRDLFYDGARIGELAGVIAALAQERGTVSAADYRDAVGLGRKRAIQILEFFDRVGYTRRVRDTHVLRGDSAANWKAHAPGGAAGLQTQEGASDASW